MTGHLGRTAIFIQEANKLRRERERMIHSGLNDITSKVNRVKRQGEKNFVKLEGEFQI